MSRIGLISDTHGLLRPEAEAFLRGCERIVHAGDVGEPGVLQALGRLAPVTAVRGNNDTGGWAEALPHSEVLQLGEALVYVVHDIAEIEVDPAAAGFHAVVFGHSHRPLIERREGVLYVNPGSAGPRRFSLPIAAAELYVSGTSVEARLVQLVGR